MANQATKVGAGDTAQKSKAAPGFIPFRQCCECGRYERVFAWWEQGDAAVCSEDCNTLKANRELARPHYLPAHLSPIVEDGAD